MDPPSPVKGFTYDISIGGARIRAVDSFKSRVGSSLRIESSSIRGLRVEGQVDGAATSTTNVSHRHRSGAADMVNGLSLIEALHNDRNSRAARASRFRPGPGPEDRIRRDRDSGPVGPRVPT